MRDKIISLVIGVLFLLINGTVSAKVKPLCEFPYFTGNEFVGVIYDARFWDEQWFNTTLPNGGIKFRIEAPNVLPDGSRLSDHISKVLFRNINQDFNVVFKQPLDLPWGRWY